MNSEELLNFPIEKIKSHFNSVIKLAVYNNVLYEFSFDENYNLDLISDNIVNQSSVAIEDNSYVTKVSLNDVSDIIENKLYAEYKDNIFPIGYVSNNFENIELLSSRRDDIDEAGLGFKFSPEYRTSFLSVKKSDITKFLCESRSVYNEMVKYFSEAEEKKNLGF